MVTLPEHSTLKNKMGKMLTNNLFLERRLDATQDSPFTLKRDDHTGDDGRFYISMRKVYLEIADPTEYKFAMTVFGNWDHWVALQGNVVLLEHIDKWRKELHVKLTSEAVLKVEELSKGTGASALSAAKYIAERGWESKRGRPSKLEVEKERKINAGIQADLDDHYETLTKHKSH